MLDAPPVPLPVPALAPPDGEPELVALELPPEEEDVDDAGAAALADELPTLVVGLVVPVAPVAPVVPVAAASGA